MWHKPCRTFHPWCPCIKTRCLSVMWEGNDHKLLKLVVKKERANTLFSLVDREPDIECHLYLIKTLFVGRPEFSGRNLPLSWWCHQMETFPHYWPFVRGFHQWPVDSPHKDQWRGTWKFSLICARTTGRANNRDAGDLRRHPNYYDVAVLK